MKVLTVFGTRPEAIKMAPIVKELSHQEAFNPQIESKVAVTGQHREMLDQVLKLFQIEPDFDLNVMETNQNLAELTSRIILGMTQVFKEFRPDIVLVHGDTTTTFAVSLAAFYEKVKVGHVEAGLRTHNLQSPWPEEANRQLTDILADIYFAPTEGAAQNLVAEGKDPNRIHVTGNTVIDALLYVVDQIRSSESKQLELQKVISRAGYKLKFAAQTKKPKKFILTTGHRRENFGEGFQNICHAMKSIAQQFPDVDLVYPVHLNPNVCGPVMAALDGIQNIYLIDPLEYEPFVYLMDQCHIILTDSGGIQEEAPSLGKPVLVMRDVTERPEAVEAGAVKLVGSEFEAIRAACVELLTDEKAYAQMAQASNPFGDGGSAKRIIEKFG